MSDISDSDSSEYASEEDQEDLADLDPRSQGICNHEALHDKLEEIMWEGAEFVDTQASTSREDEQIQDIEDDLQRELVFYNQALAGAQAGIRTLEDRGVPWLRPPDYYAEMVKSDGHMANIKQRLFHEQKRIEEAEERRKQRDAKKMSKEVQAERLKEKAQARKTSISAVTKLRKQRQKQGFQGELDMDAELAAMNQHRNSGPQRISKSKNPTSKRREAKNAKFGFGGRKRLGKQNDAVSAANMDGYKGSRGKAKGGKGNNRPGKARRAAARTK